MARIQAKPPSLEDIRRCGHIASALRSYMKVNHLSPGDFNQLLGWNRSNTRIYQYLNCRFPPAEKIRIKLAEVMGISPAELIPHNVNEKAIAILPSKAESPTTPMIPPARDVLQFAVDSKGMASIRLNVVLPVATAMPLLRMLLDAGCVISPPGEAS